MEIYKKTTVPIGSKKLKEDPSLIERGVFVDNNQAPEYCEEYQKIIKAAAKGRA